jgi:hypothetical protein
MTDEHQADKRTDRQAGELPRVVKGQVWEDMDSREKAPPARRTITVLETPNIDVPDPGEVRVEVMGLVRSRIALRRFGTRAYRLKKDV